MMCPQCGDPVTLAGAISENDCEFRPSGLRFFVFSRAVELRDVDFHACTGCGLVWNRVDPAALRSLVDKSASEELLESLRHKAGQP